MPLRKFMCLILIFTTKLMGEIDVNKVEDDIVEEYIAPGNEGAIEMLERLSEEIFWMTPQEIYLRWILNEIKAINAKWDKKSPSDSEKLLKYLQAIDSIMWFSKDKRDVKIVTQMGSMSDIMWKIRD